jgi:hypothetical protein
MVNRSVNPSLVCSTPLRIIEVRGAPGSPGFSGKGAGSLGSEAKTAGENCETEKTAASAQSNVEWHARKEDFRLKLEFIMKNKFLAGGLPLLLTALHAARFAAERQRCAAVHSGWGHGAANPEAP